MHVCMYVCTECMYGVYVRIECCINAWGSNRVLVRLGLDTLLCVCMYVCMYYIQMHVCMQKCNKRQYLVNSLKSMYALHIYTP